MAIDAQGIELPDMRVSILTGMIYEHYNDYSGYQFRNNLISIRSDNSIIFVSDCLGPAAH